MRNSLQLVKETSSCSARGNNYYGFQYPKIHMRRLTIKQGLKYSVFSELWVTFMWQPPTKFQGSNETQKLIFYSLTLSKAPYLIASKPGQCQIVLPHVLAFLDFWPLWVSKDIYLTCFHSFQEPEYSDSLRFRPGNCTCFSANEFLVDPNESFVELWVYTITGAKGCMMVSQLKFKILPRSVVSFQLLACNSRSYINLQFPWPFFSQQIILLSDDFRCIENLAESKIEFSMLKLKISIK